MRVLFALCAGYNVYAVPIGGVSKLEASLEQIEASQERKIDYLGSLLNRAYISIDGDLGSINHGIDTAYVYVFSEPEKIIDLQKSLKDEETVVKNVGFVEAAIIASKSDPKEPTYIPE